MVEKCLGHTKPSIKSKSLECVLFMFEITENFDNETLDNIEELCKSKMAKVSLRFNYILDLVNCSGTVSKPHSGLRYKKIPTS